MLDPTRYGSLTESIVDLAMGCLGASGRQRRAAAHRDSKQCAVCGRLSRPPQAIATCRIDEEPSAGALYSNPSEVSMLKSNSQTTHEIEVREKRFSS